MQYLKSLAVAVFSRVPLVLAAFLLAGFAIWWGGPLLALDGLRPLASAGPRAALIGLLLALGILWLAQGPVGLVAVVAFGLLLWFIGPQISLGSSQPLASLPVRLVCIGVLFLLCLFYAFYRLLRKLEDDPGFLRRLLSFAPADAENRARRDTLAPMVVRLAAVVEQLRQLQSGGFWRRRLEKNRHLYALPWFLLIGGPGAGKTAALRQSGLQFPLAMFRGAEGPTRDCDWWLGNDAVLIDTAGRYCGAGAQMNAAPVEWLGLLGLLKRQRPRAPVNGVVLVLSVADLLQPSDAERSQHAAILRERLTDIRRELGIRCPVYLLLTQVDRLRGFRPYFQSLTSEGRTQVWGFSRPPGRRARRFVLTSAGMTDMAAQQEALRQWVALGMAQLIARLDAGLKTRLKEEFDADRRRALFALPLELSALAGALVRTVEDIFLDSRFDDTQALHGLRGVYFCSAEQAAGPGVPADRQTVFGQLAQLAHLDPSDAMAAGEPVEAVAGSAKRAEPEPATAEPPNERQGYFLHELFTRIVIPEAGLVRPNLRWELRFRLLRFMGHGLALLVFAWLAAALVFSWRNNRHYLEDVRARTSVLHTQVSALLARPREADAPAVLDVASRWPLRTREAGAADLPAGFAYGLDTLSTVSAASDQVYARLQQITLLPRVTHRMEDVIVAGMRAGDGPAVYATLRAYQLLHDPARYQAEGGAAEVRAWVQADPEMLRGPSAAHLQSLFSSNRPLDTGEPPDVRLVHEAQQFLDRDTSSQRIYQRAKTALLPEAPPDFTLVRAVGPQVGVVFSREAGQALETGVPGLFTREGYHGLFAPRLAAFVGRAAAEDAWVMGRGHAERALAAQADPELLEDVRRQYLDEYARHWTGFLDSIRAVGAGTQATSAAATPSAVDDMSASLGFELNVVRQLAAPDSPLARLARAVAVETTLSQSLATPAAQAEGPGLLDRLARQTVAAVPGARPPGDEAIRHRLEREQVDNRFAALRELVTGQADVNGQGGAASTGPSRPGLEALMAAINEFYTQLVVADSALAAGGLPPGGAEIGARLLLEAGKLPPPLREVLISLARTGAEKVTLGGSAILRRQAQTQFDRLMGLMAQSVGEPCRRGIEGHYPFTDSAGLTQDAAIEDVTQLFSSGGAAEDFFNRYLAAFVETSVRPWRYRSSVASPAENGGPGGPTFSGELLKLLARNGPDPEAFYRSQQIRELFFPDVASRKLRWSLELSVLELDPSITELLIDIDGQGQRYIHGPVQALHVDWPGPRGGSMASFTANPRISPASSSVATGGAWALLRLLDQGRIVHSATAGRTSVELSFDGRKALIGISARSQPNPLNSDVLRGFHCPASLRTARATL